MLLMRLRPRAQATSSASKPPIRPSYGDVDLMHDVAMTEISISLDDDLVAELVQVAQDEGTTEAELIREGVERLLHSRLTGSSIPRFARRLGPLALPEKHVEH